MSNSKPEAMPTGLHCHALGYIQSPYQEKFAVPRQPGLVDSNMQLQLIAPYNSPECVRGLEQFSHLWLIFAFHQHLSKGWSPLIRPPRLGGNKKVGVFASRSSFRPNPIGMSVVKLKHISLSPQGPCLHLSGGDLVTGTPILDIKPYISYADSYPDAQGGYANSAPISNMQVMLSPQAQLVLEHHQQEYPEFSELIKQVLAQDPRPAYQKNKPSDREYGVKLYQFDVRWQVIDVNTFMVTQIVKL